MEQLISSVAPMGTALAIIAFALPSYISFLRQRGPLKALLALVLLSGLILVAQGVALQFNYPFGDFDFGDALGYRLFGVVPWVIAFAYVPLVLAVFWTASKITSSFLRVILGGLFLAIINVVIDPALAFTGLRSWENGGPFLGVPVINFAGWFICGVLAVWVLHSLWGREKSVGRGLAYSGFAITWFWTGVNLGLKQYVPGGIGLAIGILLLVLMSVEKRRAKKADD